VQCAATIQALGGAGAHADTLKALAEGRALGTWALYEHGSGQAPLAGTLTAERTTTGWRLSGTQANVVYGHRADVIVAFAATAEGGANAFVLRSGQLGLSAQMQTRALGMRAAPRATLTLDDVQRAAHLARIAIDDAEAEAALAQLTRVFGLIEDMQAVDISGIAPMAHAQDLMLRLRADAVTEGDQRQLFQSVAPEVEAGLYLVPKVIE
jgi:aspartyl-tRNA(Asn)/glutamyl-tRNA(Gln) amidotransferase subunit C